MQAEANQEMKVAGVQLVANGEKGMGMFVGQQAKGLWCSLLGSNPPEQNAEQMTACFVAAVAAGVTSDIPLSLIAG